MLRAHQLRCAALIGGYARTAEAQALVRSGWAHDLTAPRQALRLRLAGGRAGGLCLRTGTRPGRTHRETAFSRPSMQPDCAGRRLAGAGAGTQARLCTCAVLRTMPDHRAVQALHRSAVAAGRDAPGAICRWCGREELALRCVRCGSDTVRAVVVGAAALQRNSAGRSPGCR